MNPRVRIPPKEFCKQSGLSKVTLWRLAKNNPDFPKPVYILNRKFYYQDEVTPYIESLEQSEPPKNNLDNAKVA